MESLIQLRRMEENLKKIKTKDWNYALRITKIPFDPKYNISTVYKFLL